MWRQPLALLLAGLFLCAAADDDDDQLGLGRGGYLNLTTRHFEAVLVRDAQVLASLRPAGSAFDFLPLDYLPRRARHGQYHWGDITFRYRTAGAEGDTAWTDGDSAAARRPVVAAAAIGGDEDDENDTRRLAAAHMGPTLPRGPLNVTREWLDVAGDLGLRFTVANTGAAAVEVGSLGFPAEFNSIFTGRHAADMARVCSLADPYIGMHAGHLRIAPARGDGPALVVTPLGDAPLEAYRNLVEPYHEDTAYGSQTFEGFYEWQVLSKAWAENEWRGARPWNPPSSRILQPGESMTLGVRFSAVPGGVREMDAVIQSTDTPVALGVPGFIIPRGSAASLYLRAGSEVRAVTAAPAAALAVRRVAAGVYAVTPAATAWGRVRLDVVYTDGRVQTVHYFVTKPGTEAVGDLGRFATTAQWFNDTSDPFGRAPSVMTYDHAAQAIVTQDARAWVAGLSDEGGAGSFLAAAMKQAVQPDAAEVAKLEQFVDGVLWKTIQTPDYSVRKSIFFHDPEAVPGYAYDAAIDWTSWTSWNKEAAYATDRAYDYVHVAATYWALYRVARAYPALVSYHTWDWYLTQAYRTIARGMQADVGYNRVGLMGETVFGETLEDLRREGKTPEADDVTEKMRDRALQWDSEEVPFGSEMAWDSTGQEGVYYWSKYFGLAATATKTVNSVLGFMPTVPHWGWDGNARRYWDNVYAGKLRRIERQIHHYGSGLNALVLLSAFRSNASDTYLLRVGYGGASGPVSSIHQDGFAAASFHSWPETLEWDGYSGDYGSNFVGLALGSGTYVADMDGVGLAAFGGTIANENDDSTGAVVVTTADPVRRRIFIGPLGVLVTVDAGIIRAFRYWPSTRRVEVTLSHLEGAPKAAAAVVWVESPSGSANYTVTAPEMVRERLGWRVPLSSGDATVTISSQ